MERRHRRSRRRKRLAVLGVAVVALLALARAVASPSAVPSRVHSFFVAGASAPQVVAHRGGMAEGPENTIEAFRRALARGADVVEMDVRSSADGELVVIHDATVDRTTDGTGRVDAMPLSALQSLDAAYRFTPDGVATPLRGRGVRIPTLAEVFEALPSARIAVEIKPSDEGSLAAQMCDVIRAAGAEHRTLVASFAEAETLLFRAACPEVATAATPPEGFRFWLLGALSGEHPPPDALIVPNRIGPLRIATRAFVESARRQGLRVHTWLANERQEVVTLHDAGLDAVLTDHPERVSRWLRERRVE